MKFRNFTNVFFFDRSDLDVYEERGSWFTNSEQFYVRYVSSDFAQDANLTAYPPTYVEFIAGLLALRTVERLTQGTTKKEDLEDDVKKMLLKAKSNDARNLKDTRPRPGRWIQALGGQTGRRGQIGTLVGGQIQLQEEDI